MWKTLVNLIFPKYCVQCKRIGNYICDNCFSYIRFDPTPICPKCNKQSIEGATHPRCRTLYSIDGLVSAVVYTGVIKRLVHQYKYNPYVSDLRDDIGRLMCESLEQNEIFFNFLKDKPVLIPVPLHPMRLSRRGYNHSWLLCSYVAQYFKQEVNNDVLVRTRNTKPQFKLSKNDRYSNVKDAFKIQESQKKTVKGRTILIIDDIATTCSTLGEIAKVLKRNGAKSVWGVVFAREELTRTKVGRV